MSWRINPLSTAALTVYNFEGSNTVPTLRFVNNPDREKTIKVTTDSAESYDRLIQSLGTSVYYEAFPDDKTIQLKSSDHRLLLNLLLSLIAFDESIVSIEGAIRSAFQLPRSLLPYQSIPDWVKRGNFLFDLSNNTEPNTLIRNQVYQNTQPGAVIREIRLNGYQSGRVQLLINPAIDGERTSYSAAAIDFHRLITDMQNSDFLRAAVSPAIFAAITATLSAFAVSRMPPLPGAPLFFSNFARPNRFAQRIHQFVADLNAASNNANLAAGIQASLSLPTSSPLPVPESLNDKKLAEYTTKLEVPDELCCGISGVIMDKPMHFPGSAGHYNEAHIALWVKEKKRHPATGVTLRDDQKFVHDEAKQADVNKFMETAKAAQLPPSAHGKRRRVN